MLSVAVGSQAFARASLRGRSRAVRPVSWVTSRRSGRKRQIAGFIGFARPLLALFSAKSAFERAASPAHAAFDGALGAADDLRRLLVAEAPGRDEGQRVALHRRQGAESALEIAHIEMRVLLALLAGRPRNVRERRHARARAQLVVKLVAQDRRKPRFHVGSRGEFVAVAQRAQRGLLHQIVGQGAVAGEKLRKGAQTGEVLDESFLKRRHDFVLLSASQANRREILCSRLRQQVDGKRRFLCGSEHLIYKLQNVSKLSRGGRAARARAGRMKTACRSSARLGRGVRDARWRCACTRW